MKRYLISWAYQGTSRPLPEEEKTTVLFRAEKPSGWPSSVQLAYMQRLSNGIQEMKRERADIISGKRPGTVFDVDALSRQIESRESILVKYLPEIPFLYTPLNNAK